MAFGVRRGSATEYLLVYYILQNIDESIVIKHIEICVPHIIAERRSTDHTLTSSFSELAGYKDFGRAAIGVLVMRSDAGLE